MNKISHVTVKFILKLLVACVLKDTISLEIKILTSTLALTVYYIDN